MRNSKKLHNLSTFSVQSIDIGPERNNRDDEYGGCFDGRFRFIKDVISGIKAVCGTKFIVSVRFGNAHLDELKKEAAAIENSGADLLDVSYGCKAPFGLPKEFPYDNKIYMASLVKEISHVPVIAVGRIRSGEQAEQIIKCGYADMVAVGTGHLCDPKWTKKIFSGQKVIMCKNCKQCLWYIDGMKCPARKL